MRLILLIVQRAIVWAAVFAALVLWPRAGVLGLVAGLALAGAGYAVAERLLAGIAARGGWAQAFRYNPLAAVIVPDWLGLLASAGLAAVPVLATGRGDAPHPSLWLLWPMAALFLILPVIGARRGGFALRITPAGLELRGAARTRSIVFPQIARITRWRRDLPKWLRALSPLALMLGQPGAAGAVMLARPSTGLALALRDGGRIVIPCDGFAAGRSAILGAARAHGVPAPSR